MFNECILTGDTSLRGVSLGRPWRPYGSVTYIHCYLGNHIKPEGWANWNTTEYYKTARYAEFENFGPGAEKAGRVTWARELNAGEAGKITMQTVFGDWNPESGK